MRQLSAKKADPKANLRTIGKRRPRPTRSTAWVCTGVLSAAFSGALLGALSASSGGCTDGLFGGATPTSVLYVITNNAGAAITYNLSLGGVDQADQTLGDGKTANILATCNDLTEFRMNMVCAEGGTDCNILGIVIMTNEVECGDIVEVVVGPAQNEMLFLSATRRQEATAPDNAANGTTDSSAS